MSVDVLAFGEPLFELSQVERGGQQVFLPGFGGDTSNAAIAATRQGADVGVLTRLGSDAFGDRFIELWRQEGVDTSAVTRDEDAATGLYLISYDERGHHFTYFREGSAASRIGPEDLPREAIARCKVLHLSGITQAISTSSCDAAFAAIELARENGVAVSYDTNLRLKLWPLARARATIMATIALCDYCLPSLDDARQLTGLQDPFEIVALLARTGAANVLLKMGPEGVLLAGAGQREPVHVPAFEVEAVDATGAGDCFDGAFLAEMARGATLEEAARYANAAAALSTLGNGAVAPIPRREDVERFISKG